MNSVVRKTGWDWVIKPETKWFDFQFKELWAYRHLLFRLIRRDFLIHHQQTLLGPLWIILQPIIVLFTYVIIFQKAVGISTDGLPPYLFYLSGIIVWNLFSECFTGTSFTFTQNATLFGKVYFPRLIIPLSVIAMNVIRFGIQFILFILLLLFYIVVKDYPAYILRWIPVFIFVTVLVSGTGLGLGLIFSTLTAKYRDLVNIIHLGVRLLMFATPVIYPLSAVRSEIKFLVTLNPLSPAFEFFRFGFLGHGNFEYIHLFYSSLIMVLTIFIGTLLFNKFGSKLQDVL